MLSLYFCRIVIREYSCNLLTLFYSHYVWLHVSCAIEGVFIYCFLFAGYRALFCMVELFIHKVIVLFNPWYPYLLYLFIYFVQYWEMALNSPTALWIFQFFLLFFMRFVWNTSKWYRHVKNILECYSLSDGSICMFHSV